jgi:hypothetical protein
LKPEPNWGASFSSKTKPKFQVRQFFKTWTELGWQFFIKNLTAVAVFHGPQNQNRNFESRLGPA